MALFYKIKGMKINKMKASPVNKNSTKKSNGKKRQLNIPSLIDRAVQILVKLALEPRFEAVFEDGSYGFRPLRNSGNSIAHILQYTQVTKRLWVFKGNFKSSFDTLNHEWIIKQLGNFPAKNIIQSWLQAGYVHNDLFSEAQTGSSQGGIISPLLANIALHGMEEALNVTYENGNGGYTSTHSKYVVVRYLDEFVVLCRTEEDAQNTHQLLEAFLEERGLTLTPEKTLVTKLYKGFDFHEFNVRAYTTQNGDKIIIQPSRKSQKNFNTRMKKIFVKNADNVNELIRRANRLINETTRYWKQTNAQNSFNKADNYTWTLTKRFVKRKHPNKPWSWINNKYFKEDHLGKHEDKHIFTDPEEPNMQLQKMAWTPIQYAEMINHDFSPYNKECKDYMQEKWGLKPYECLYREHEHNVYYD